MIDIQRKTQNNYKITQLKKELPFKCRECSHLEIIDLDNKKVKCFYNITGVCMLK